jgi:hypothetical protein
VIATYNTDYILVEDEKLEIVIEALRGNGFGLMNELAKLKGYLQK